MVGKGLMVGIMVLVFAFSASAGPVTTGLVSWWNFDETSGLTAADSWGANNGTLSGNATWTTDTAGPVSSGALSFDGNQAYVDAGAGVGNNLRLQVFTYTAWVKLATPWDYNNPAIIGGGPYSAGQPEFRVMGNKSVQLLKQNTAGIGFSTSALTLDTWTHVGVTYDAVGNYNFYIDGQPSGSGTSPQTFAYAGGIWIGGAANGDYLKGTLDEVGIYNRVLTPAEIQQNMNAVIPEPATLLLLGGGLLGSLFASRRIGRKS